jgi:Flp pilus assembly protein TadG
MTKKRIKKFLQNKERGQAIVLIAMAMVGVIAMVGLVTDTGILFIEYGKLKRGVDAAAISAAQQYRLENASDTTLNAASLENAATNFLQLNDADVEPGSIIVVSCESPEDERPAKCNDDPIGDSVNNRKYVQVTASKTVDFGFLTLIGIESTTISVTSLGEAATIDLVLVIDTSASMAFETDTTFTDSGAPFRSDPGDDPHACNPTNTCQPMKAVKDVALDFIDTLYFPYDRVAIVTMTGQEDGTAVRTPELLLDLSSDRTDVVNTISGIRVFDPQECDVSGLNEGVCRNYDSVTGSFLGLYCEIFEMAVYFGTTDFPDFRSCPSSNIGGVLNLAATALTDPGLTRLDSYWVVVALIGGPANATDIDDPTDHPLGFCPWNTFLAWGDPDGDGVNGLAPFGPACRDRSTATRHNVSDTIMWHYPTDGPNEGTQEISIYDADDYARDRADELATLTTGEGITIYTIGLGTPIQSTATSDDGVPPAEDLLIYIAEEAGGPDINHGQYFFAPTSDSLSTIFEKIANNIATRISE